MDALARRAETSNGLVNAQDLASPSIIKDVSDGGAVVMMTPAMMDSSLPYVCPTVEGYLYRSVF